MAVSSNRRRNGRRMKNEMNVVPYIDVMLVLLVIFMVTAPMITPGLVNLPSVGQAATVPATPLEIQLEESGDISVRLREPGQNFEKVTQDNLLQYVKSHIQENTPIVIAADGKVSYDKVMKIVDTLNSNGITKLALLVNEKAGSAGTKK